MSNKFVGRILGGKYLIEAELARGADDVSFRALDLDLDRLVSVQLVEAGAVDVDWVRRFRNEARILSRVRHANILEIYDFGQAENGTPFIAFERPNGPSLQHKLAHGRLEPDAVVDILLELARALSYAHQFGVFHTAVSPDRVYLWPEDGVTQVRIGDFLASRWHSVDQSRPPIADYRMAAPEMLRGEPPTPAAEVYGLGQLAYACLVGGLPVPQNEASAARAMHLSPKPWALPKDVGRQDGLAELIERCMSKEPHKRFPDCGSLVSELERWRSSVVSTQRLPAVQPQVAFFPEVGDTFADRYVVESITGHGAFARVFRARSLESGQIVALKILRPDRTANAAEARRFVREGKLVFMLLTNPHTISVYGYGETDDGLLYIAFEFIDGQSLQELVAISAVPAQRVVRILEQCLVSLAEAHGMGVLHRDIKPSNIMISQRGGVDDWVTVLDFGVAKITSDVIDASDLTLAGKALGTPRYMPPEQISGEPLGPDSDLYSLGLVAYEMLTGGAAVVGENVLDILSAQLDPQSVILPAEANVPVPLALVVNRLMRKERKSRYANAREVLTDLMNLERDVGDRTLDTGAR